MQMSDSLAEKILKDAGVDDSRILELLSEVKTTHLPLSTLILHNEVLSEEELAQAYAKELGLPFVHLSANDINHAHLKTLPEHMSRRHRVVVFNIQPDQNKLIASDTQLPPSTQALLTKVLGPNFAMHIAAPSHIHSALDVYRQTNSSKPKVIPKPSDKHKASTVLETVHHIIEAAINRQASSVHIEPKSNVLVIRFRVDGVLRETHKLPLSASAAINSRFKAMAGLAGFGAQEGRFRIESHHHIYRIEVLTLPVIDGEKLTLNIYNESVGAPKLKELELFGKNLEAAEHALINKHGLVLVSGPKDNGTNTALYSLLENLRIGNLNVLTIEDKLSYRVSGAAQIELNASLPTYEAALIGAARQDPEVLLINKVLSPVTADHIINVSKHSLVLAGINASSSFNSLAQLSSFGIETFRLAHAARLCLSVRLVRRLCEDCKRPVHPTNASLKSLMLGLGINSYGGIKAVNQLEKQAAADEISELKKTDLSSTESGIKRLYEANPAGCADCSYTGFKGRIGLQEVLTLNDELKSKIASNADINEILKLAVKSGFTPLSIDGLVKALRGLTTVEEVLTCL